MCCNLKITVRSFIAAPQLSFKIKCGSLQTGRWNNNLPEGRLAGKQFIKRKKSPRNSSSWLTLFSVQSWSCLEKWGGSAQRGGGGGGGVRFEVLHKGKAQHCALSCVFAGTQHAPVFLQISGPSRSEGLLISGVLSAAGAAGRRAAEPELPPSNYPKSREHRQQEQQLCGDFLPPSWNERNERKKAACLE